MIVGLRKTKELIVDWIRLAVCTWGWIEGHNSLLRKILWARHTQLYLAVHASDCSIMLLCNLEVKSLTKVRHHLCEWSNETKARGCSMSWRDRDEPRQIPTPNDWVTSKWVPSSSLFMREVSVWLSKWGGRRAHLLEYVLFVMRLPDKAIRAIMKQLETLCPQDWDSIHINITKKIEDQNRS